MDHENKDLDLASLVDKVVREHGATPDSVIPILSEINRTLGYIPAGTLPEIRRRIQIPQEGVFLADSHVYSAASFYQMFSLKPLGRHVIRFCESAPCHVEGGRQVIEALQKDLGCSRVRPARIRNGLCSRPVAWECAVLGRSFWWMMTSLAM